MSWLAVAPVALVCAAWLFLPGVLLTYTLGLRGVAAWGVAPIVSVALVATTTTLAGVAKVALSWYLVAATAGILTALIGGVALLVRRRVGVVGPADPIRVTAVAALGLLPAIVLGTVTLIQGFSTPDGLSHTYDAVFHYSGVSSILETRNGSPWAVGSLGDPTAPSVFYPAAWHNLTVLTVLSTGTAVPIAVNLVSGALAVLCWPIACVLLVRQVVGRSVAAMAITGVVSIGFVGFPWSLLSFGVLWPNTLGLSLVPAALAIVLSIAGQAKDDLIGRLRAWLLAPVALVALGSSHPNAVFSLAALMIFPILAGAVARARRLRQEGRTGRGVAEVTAIVIGFLGVWAWAATAPALAAVRSVHWAPFETPAQAVGEVIAHSPNGRPAHWLLSFAVLVGVLAAWRRSPGQRWLVAGMVASGVLYTLTASVNVPETQKYTGFWYNDSFRLAAMLPITAVPLLVCGILLLATVTHAWIHPDRGAVPEAGAVPGADAVPEADAVAATGRRPHRIGRFTSVAGLAVAFVVILTLATEFLYLPSHRETLREAYLSPGDSAPRDLLVDHRERAFLAGLRDQLPADAVVANNPWDGSTLLWPLTGRRPLFGHVTPIMSDDRTYLAQHLVDAGTDPAVCQAAERLGVEYMILGTFEFWKADRRIQHYPGIVDPAGRPGFELVAEDGPSKLFRLTACAGPAATPR